MKKYLSLMVTLFFGILLVGTCYMSKRLEENSFDPDSFVTPTANLKEKEEYVKVASQEQKDEDAHDVEMEEDIYGESDNEMQNSIEPYTSTNDNMEYKEKDSLFLKQTPISVVSNNESQISEYLNEDMNTQHQEEDTTREETENMDEESKVGFVIGADGMLEHYYEGDDSVKDGYLELPTEGCVGISSGAFSTYNGEIYEIYVPANITKIEPGAFVGLDMLEWLDIDKTNGSYVSKDGVVFSSTMKDLIAFPPARTGIYQMPESVETIVDYAFYGTELRQLNLLNIKKVNFGIHVFECMKEGLTLRVPLKYEHIYESELKDYSVRIMSVKE